MWNSFVDFLFPKVCVGCGKLETDFCDLCKKEMAISEQICPMCGRSSLLGWTHEKCKNKLGMDGLTVLFQYQDVMTRAVIDAIKYDFNQRLVAEILEGMSFEIETDLDVITSVPLYYYRRNWRGFNQAEEIVKAISSQTSLVYKDLLSRIKNTKQQALMKTRRERLTNVNDAFLLKVQDKEELKVEEGGSSWLEGKRVLLVDDVFTSGANMRECTKVLKKEGAKFVWGFALAH